MVFESPCWLCVWESAFDSCLLLASGRQCHYQEHFVCGVDCWACPRVECLARGKSSDDLREEGYIV